MAATAAKQAAAAGNCSECRAVPCSTPLPPLFFQFFSDHHVLGSFPTLLTLLTLTILSRPLIQLCKLKSLRPHCHEYRHTGSSNTSSLPVCTCITPPTLFSRCRSLFQSLPTVRGASPFPAARIPVQPLTDIPSPCRPTCTACIPLPSKNDLITASSVHPLVNRPCLSSNRITWEDGTEHQRRRGWERITKKIRGQCGSALTELHRTPTDAGLDESKLRRMNSWRHEAAWQLEAGSAMPGRSPQRRRPHGHPCLPASPPPDPQSSRPPGWPPRCRRPQSPGTESSWCR